MKKFLPHLGSIALFFLITVFYCLPAFQGKQIVQQDNVQGAGMAREITDYYKETGKATLWTNSMFSGMPGFQIWVAYPGDVMTLLHRGLKNWLPEPANKIFLLLLTSYIFLFVLGTGRWLSVIGAVALTFPSYNFIFIEAGHSTKVMALGYMFGVLAGVILAYRGRLLAGALVAAVFFTLEVKSNHFQITYYLMMMILALFIIFLVKSFREKQLAPFAKATGMLALAALLGFGNNTAHLWSTYEYAKHTIRGGKSELSSGKAENTGGLDKEYALRWSYGKMETFTLLVPNFAGGSSGETVLAESDSKTLRALQKLNNPEAANQIARSVSNYWGEMPFTSGPAYMGAVICFLFIIGIMLVRSELRTWAIVIASVSILLAWGRHLEWFTDLFFYYFPFYNKFRAVSTTLVMTQVAMPLLAVLGLHTILTGNLEKAKIEKAIKYGAGIAGGICLLMGLVPSAFGSFTRSFESQLPSEISQALAEDRMGLLRADAFRSLAFIVAAAGILWMYARKAFSETWLLAGIGLLITVDLWGVNKRYLNEDNFRDEAEHKSLVTPSEADRQIMQDKTYYRVFNRSVDSFNDALTSYHHFSAGGYHAAKLRRYQDIIEHHLSRGNMAVFSMLNTKYFISPSKENLPVAQLNPGALGNAWFVKEVKVVAGADEEIAALNGLNPAVTAVVDKRFGSVSAPAVYDSAATISLTGYKPDELAYISSAATEQLAVFSEVYYPDGWEVTVDGKEAAHFRVNYILRAMKVPAGDHEIVFRFRPQSYYAGIKVTWGFQVVLLAGILFALYRFYRKLGSN